MQAQPFCKIGSLSIQGPAVLAPMAGVTDKAFRQLCASFGAAAVTSEMVSAKALTYGDKKSFQLLSLSQEERPAGVQLFGSDPETMAQAAALAMQVHPDFIDINMGCPAPKITGSGCGSALMKDPDLCGRITHAVKQSVTVPVTVKIRKGWDANSVNAVAVARICAQAGADAVTVHGRTREQQYTPGCDWDIIRAVKQAVDIPVIGNGDVDSPQAAARMLEETGCDLVMVGRGALGNPWLFQHINAYLGHGAYLPDPSVPQRIQVLRAHIRHMCQEKGEAHAMREARKHVAWYLKGLRGAAAFRKEAGSLETLEQLDSLCVRILRQNPPEATLPDEESSTFAE
ncbi:MAG TPA: tRNA dihydrouridine synthase DusB [Candidatus Gallacutalibacter stercoravium]|nr:tRNA dihydrouridine synthase DusB [Candidatus Gallacutalibacter stercoravium]